jgi:putative aldouronate transport system substrate-binding protein
MSRKIVSIILIMLMSLGIFTGCGQKKSTGKLTVGIPQDSTIPNYNENAFCKYLEEASGVDIEWVYFASSAASAQQQLTLMCTGGEKLPDVLLGFQGMGHYVVNQFGEDGFIVDLTELIDKYGVNYKKQLEQLPEDTRKVVQKKMVNTNTGEIYSLPLVSCPAIDGRQSLVYINQTWLDNLNLEIPTTVEDLYNVLLAFATEDPNQNGDNDEIPMLAESHGYNYLINAFVQYQSGAFYVEDGKVCDATKTSEFREAMKYINKLVTEGLYSELSFTIGDAEYKSMLSPTDEISKVGIFGGHHESMTDASTNTLSNYTALPALQDATGSGKGGS